MENSGGARVRRQLQAVGRVAAYLGGGFLLLSTASTAAVRSLRYLSDSNQVTPPRPQPIQSANPSRIIHPLVLTNLCSVTSGNSRRLVVPARGREPTRAGSAGAAPRSSGLPSTTRCSSIRASALLVMGPGWPSSIKHFLILLLLLSLVLPCKFLSWFVYFFRVQRCLNCLGRCYAWRS